MSKRLEVKGIESCEKCLYFVADNYNVEHCSHNQAPRQSAVDRNSIPDWCPLPDEEA